MLGLCVSPSTKPDLVEVKRLRAPFLRSVLYHLEDDLRNLFALGVPLLISLNNECAEVRGDWSEWWVAVQRICQLAEGRVIGITAGNELDVYWSRNHADTPPAVAANLVNLAQGIAKPYGIPIGTTSLGGPEWPEYLSLMLKMCNPDAVVMNPYGWIWAGLEAKIDQLEEAAPGREVWLNEVGAKLADVGGPNGQADRLTEAAEIVTRRGALASWFAWHDLNGAPWERGDQAFGLLDENGQRRPAWYAYQKLGQEPIPMPPHEHVVGPGVVAKMTERGDSPASCERYETGPHNTEAEYSETYGRSGTKYVYLFDLNEVVAIGRAT